LESVPEERVSEASLVQAARILLPCLASTLPIMAVITIAVRGQVPLGHLELWWIAGLLAEFFILLAWWTFRKERSRGGTGLNSLPAIRSATVVAGAACCATSRRRAPWIEERLTEPGAEEPRCRDRSAARSRGASRIYRASTGRRASAC